MHPCLVSDGVPSIQSIQASHSSVLPAQTLGFVPHFHPSESLAPCILDAGCVLVNHHWGHDDILIHLLVFQSTLGHDHSDALPQVSMGCWVHVQMDWDSGKMPWVAVLFSLPLKELDGGSDGVLPKSHPSESLFLLKEAEEQEGEQATVMVGSWWWQNWNL